ncbi:hypothetical protein Tco_1000101 [Tanacetum coccineum]
MRHMYSNFKKQFRGDFFKFNIWGATNTYSITHHNRLLEEISKVSKEAIVFLNEHHNKIWSRSKFRTTSKCDYITNNISKSFNSWIGDARFRPVLDLLNSIREMLMVQLRDKRQIVKKWKGTLVPAARKYLRRISKATFIAFTRDANWDSYVDPYFTIDKFKEACALEISPIPDKDQWAPIDTNDVVDMDTLKSDGDISATEIMKWLMMTYNVDVPYIRAYRGKEQAYTDMYRKWEDLPCWTTKKE